MEGNRRVAAKTRRIATWLVYLAFGGAILAAGTAPIARWTAVIVMAKRGYQSCPDGVTDERRPPLRWRLPGGRCPGVPAD